MKEIIFVNRFFHCKNTMALQTCKVYNAICLILLFYVYSTPSFSQSIKYETTYEELIQKAEETLFSDKYKTYEILNQALTLAHNEYSLEKKLYLYDFFVYASGFYYDLDVHRKYLNLLKNALANDMVKIPNKKYYLQTLLFEEGNHNYKIGNYTRAKEKFLELQKNLTNKSTKSWDSEDIDTYGSTLNYLGAINRKQGKLNLAKEYFIQEQKLYSNNKNSLPYWESSFNNSKKLLADIYSKQGRLEQAAILLEEVMLYYRKADKIHHNNARITTSFRLTENYLRQNKIEKALETLKQSENYILFSRPFKNRLMIIRGDIFKKIKKVAKAKKAYECALRETIAYRKGIKHQDVSAIYTKLGDLEKDREHPFMALSYYQESLISASKNFEEKEISSNPKPDDVFSKTQLLTILKKKLEILNEQLIQNNEAHILEASTNTSKDLVATLDALRPEFENKVDKQFLIEQTYPAFHEMIKTAYTGYAKTKDLKYLDDAFLFMEKSKSTFLLEAIRNSEAIAFAKVPDSILEKELKYRAYIVNAEKKLLDADKESKTLLQDSLFRLNTNYYDFLSTIEKKYPQYYQLKYDTKTTSLKELQKFISNHETVLVFHQTDKELFSLAITSSTVKFLKIPFKKEIRDDVTKFHELLSKLTFNKTKEIQNLGKSIYNQILASCLENDANDQLTIIADGLLNYIPFDALIDTSTGDYLIKDKSVSYANSATLLTYMAKKKDIGENSLLAISPAFNSDSGYNPLPFSQRETSLIKSYFKGKILSGKDASIKNFINLKDGYSLLHFATHASANDKEPDFSYLAFTPENNKENRLFVKDLYNYSLHADMVTLSACESGIGKLQKGEGMLSLARGFQYAGVPSLTTTLWKNDDQATSELMGLYYKYLKKGHTKSKALQLAKLEYLNNTEEPELKHPYYWAGFVVLGDNSPISNKPISPWLLFGLGLIGTGILVFGYKKIKAHQAAA
ncbi:CHAT domain-containing protein [Maribacter sp. 2210JD10-5]|uniref:CHAT domain-containing protein n=1 Tax=Maribacter sp. 2210JD10-5 TaxID=3386272 RepID=UPI0039BD59E6